MKNKTLEAGNSFDTICENGVCLELLELSVSLIDNITNTVFSKLENIKVSILETYKIIIVLIPFYNFYNLLFVVSITTTPFKKITMQSIVAPKKVHVNYWN